MIVELEQHIMLGSLTSNGIEVDRVTGIVGVTDDHDVRIVDGADDRRSVLLEGAGAYARVVQRCDGEVEGLKNVLGQVDRTVEINYVELDTEHEINIVSISTDGMQIHKVVVMTRAGHGRSMVGNTVQLKPFRFGSSDHLVHGVVGMTACDGVRMNVEYINQTDSPFDSFRRLYHHQNARSNFF